MTNKIPDIPNPLSLDIEFARDFYLKPPPGRSIEDSEYLKICTEVANLCRNRFSLDFIAREDSQGHLEPVWKTWDSYFQDFRYLNIFNFVFPLRPESIFFNNEKIPKLLKDITKPPEKLDGLKFSAQMFKDPNNIKNVTFHSLVVGSFNPTAFTSNKDTIVISTTSTLLRSGIFEQSSRKRLLTEDNLARYLLNLRQTSAFWGEVKSLGNVISTPFGGQPEQ